MIRFIKYTLLIVAILILASCRSNKTITQYPEPSAPVVENISKSKQALIDEAYTWIGTPYKYAHANKGVGTDCSGFIMTIFYDIARIKLPRNSAEQGKFCEEIKREKLNPCDLVFFATGKNMNKITHVGMMIDSDQFIHASSSKGVVISRLSSTYYTRRLIKCGRVPNLK